MRTAGLHSIKVRPPLQYTLRAFLSCWHKFYPFQLRRHSVTFAMIPTFATSSIRKTMTSSISGWLKPTKRQSAETASWSICPRHLHQGRRRIKLLQFKITWKNSNNLMKKFAINSFTTLKMTGIRVFFSSYNQHWIHYSFQCPGALICIHWFVIRSELCVLGRMEIMFSVVVGQIKVLSLNSGCRNIPC
jgi:hypothetical protein